MNYTEIKSFEDACNAKGISTELPDVSKLPEDKRQTVINYYMLIVIASALNQDWKADFADRNQWKYYPVFWYDPAVGRLVFYVYDHTYTRTPLGARLFYKNEKIAKYAGTQFIDLYANI